MLHTGSVYLMAQLIFVCHLSSKLDSLANPVSAFLLLFYSVIFECVPGSSIHTQFSGASMHARSHKWQCGADCFCLVLCLNGIVSGTSSVVVSLDASLSSSSPGSLGALLSEGCSSCGPSYIIRASSFEEVTWSLMEQSFPHTGRKSLMWCGILSTETECWLLIFITVPSLNCVVHLPYGFFTQTASPSMYGPETVLSGTSAMSIP